MAKKVQIEKELTTTSRFGQISLSRKCKQMIKRFDSTLRDQFDSHGNKDVEYVIEILPNPKCRKSHYTLDLRRILPLLNRMKGKVRIVLPKDKPTEIRNSGSFARELQISELIFEGNELDIDRYCMCEADSLKKLTFNGVSYMSHCCCSKNRNLKELIIIPSESKNVMIEGQLYKPTDVIDISKVPSVDMEIPLLSDSPFVYVPVHACPSISVQNRIYYAIDDYKMEKAALEVNTGANYKVNTNTKFNIMIKDTDSYVNADDFTNQLDKLTKCISNMTFAELLHLPKNKIVTVKTKDIFLALTDILVKQNKAACVDEIKSTAKTVREQRAFDWRKQQEEQDRNIRSKLGK